MQEQICGSPWIIKEIINSLQRQDVEEITPSKKLQIILEHLDLAIKDKGEYIAIREMRKHICWYLKNLKDSSKIRDEINKLETRKEVEERLIKYFNNM